MVEFSGAAKELETLVVRIVADATKLKAGYSDASKASDEVSDDLKDVQKASNEVSDSLDDTAISTRKSSSVFDQFGLAVGDAGKYMDEIIKSLDLEKDAVDGAGDATEDVGKKNDKLGFSFASLDGSINDVKKSTIDFGDALIGGKGLSTALAAITPVAVVAAFAAIGASLAVVTKAAIDAADAFDRAMNTIYIGTGATGSALASLDVSLMNISGTVGNSTDEIAKALADLNTAYGLQGSELEGLSKTYLAFAKVTGDDVSGSIEKSREVWNKWGVTIEKQADMLDYFFRISQQSGVKMDTLLSMLAESDRGFQLMGLSVEEAAAMIGTLTKTDGVSAAREFASGIEMAGKQMSQELGSDSAAQHALRSMIYEMKAMGDEMEATGYAMEQGFGRGSDVVAGAIYGGALEFQSLKDSALQVGPTLIEVAKQTETLKDKMTRLGAAGQEALRPIGDSLLNGIGRTIDTALIPALEYLGKSVEVIVGLFGRIWEVSPLGIITALWDKITGNQKVIDAVQRVMNVFQRLWDRLFDGYDSISMIDKLIDLLALTIENILIPALDTLAFTLAVLTGDWEYAAKMWTQFTKDTTESQTNLFGDLFDKISGMITESIKSWITTVSTFAQTVVNTVVNSITGGIDVVYKGLDTVLSAFEAFGQSIVDYFVDMWNGLIDVFEKGFQTLLDNTPLGSILELLGVNTTVDLSRYQITAPEITLPRADILKDASTSVRSSGTTINQQISITADKTVSALDVQRAIEKANRDALRAGV